MCLFLFLGNNRIHNNNTCIVCKVVHRKHTGQKFCVHSWICTRQALNHHFVQELFLQKSHPQVAVWNLAVWVKKTGHNFSIIQVTTFTREKRYGGPLVEIGQEGPLGCAIYFDGVSFLAISGPCSQALAAARCICSMALRQRDRRALARRRQWKIWPRQTFGSWFGEGLGHLSI